MQVLLSMSEEYMLCDNVITIYMNYLFPKLQQAYDSQHISCVTNLFLSDRKT